MFEGFSPQAVEFLWDLRFHNERSWFQPRREDFLRLVDTPLRTLARQVYETFTGEFPDLGLSLKVSRIYRDARRLYGRGPYKDHMWFSLQRPNEDAGNTPGFYFELAPEYYSYGMGCYDPTPATMAKLRARIDRDPKPLEKLVRALDRREDIRLEGRPYKRPKGDPGPLLSPWYNSRQLLLTSDHNCEGALFGPELAGQVLDGYRALLPLYRYFQSLAGDPPPAKI